MDADVVERGRAAFLEQFAWCGGHADVWAAFSAASTLGAVVAALAEPWRDAGVTHVVGVESRGFLLGGAVAIELDVGFVAVRKGGGLLPGAKATARTLPDYRGRRHVLRMQRVLKPGDVAVLVDDWAERGSQAGAVQALVTDCGARLAGLSLLVDQLDGAARADFERVTALVPAAALGDSG